MPLLSNNSSALPHTELVPGHLPDSFKDSLCAQTRVFRVIHQLNDIRMRNHDSKCVLSVQLHGADVCEDGLKDIMPRSLKIPPSALFNVGM